MASLTGLCILKKVSVYKIEKKPKMFFTNQFCVIMIIHTLDCILEGYYSDLSDNHTAVFNNRTG